MSSSRPRTGLSKPRQLDKELGETVWREQKERNKDLINSDDMDAALERARTVVQPFGDLNEVALMMLDLYATYGHESFLNAFRDMQREGVAGSDYKRKIKADQGVEANSLDWYVVYLVASILRTSDVSEAQAFEEVAKLLGSDGISFDAATQKIKRAWMKWKSQTKTPLDASRFDGRFKLLMDVVGVAPRS